MSGVLPLSVIRIVPRRPSYVLSLKKTGRKVDIMLTVLLSTQRETAPSTLVPTIVAIVTTGTVHNMRRRIIMADTLDKLLKIL